MTKLKPKSPSASNATFTHLVLPSDTNVLGGAFGGRVMEWIDKAAAIVAQRHCRRIAVTASMDSLHFISPIKLGDVVILQACVNYTHHTSLEVGVRVTAENPLTSERRHTASSYLTFVAIDENGRPTTIPTLLCRTKNEKRRFKEAETRRKERLRWKRIKEKNLASHGKKN